MDAELKLVASLKAEAQIQGGILDRAKGATVALEAILKDRLERERFSPFDNTVELIPANILQLCHMTF